MDVNYEVWGNPEDWRDASSYTYYGLGDFKRPKEGVNSYYNAYDNGSLVGGEVPTDLSLAFWGIGKGSILTKPMFLAPYWDGDTIKTAAEPINDEEVSNVPCILGYASDGEGQYTLSWWNRYAPADNPGEAEWSTGNVINIWSMYREIFTAFNYQKVMLVPFVRVALGSPTDGWGDTYVSLKQYMDGMVAGGAYADYNKILAIGYQVAIGDGESSRSTGNKELSINTFVNVKGSSRHWEGVKSNRQHDWKWFATEYGINTMLDSGMLNPGSYSYARSITPYRRTGAIDFSSLHNIGDGETGLSYKYCENYKEPGDTQYNSVPIPYYYDPDNDLWKINDSLPWNTNVADPFPYINCNIANKNEVRDYILKQIAYLGFPFVYDPNMATRGKIGDIGVYLPVFDDDGITTGNYEEGSKALALPNAEWTDAREGSGYDPTKPSGGGEPTPSDNPMLPVGLEFTLADNGTGIWALTPSNIYEVLDDIFGSKMKAEVFGNNPMNAILSLKWTPFEWTATGTQDFKPVVLGNQVVNPLHSYPMITTVSQAEKHGYGTIKFNFDRNFYNARNMQARLFLPFYGYYELPTAQLLSSELRVDFYYNVPDELGVYVISYDNVIYDFVECSIDIDVPLTGSNAAAISQSKRAEALQIATQVASTALTTMAFVGTGGLSGVSQFISMSKDAGSLVGGLQSLPYLYEAAPREAIHQVAGLTTAATLTGGTATGIAGAITNGKIQRANLRTNLPYHGSALQTTFLHMSMKPYVQIFKNAIMQGLNTENGGTVKVKLGGEDEAQYKLKVGHACDVWETVGNMPDNSLLQATGLADTNTTGMELSEVQELNAILQSGFYK